MVCSKLVPECRIIPTRVGTSLGEKYCGVLKKDHPHACGDKTVLVYLDLCVKGSSPRVWGQVTRFQFMGQDIGIIPTRVGTSPKTLTFSNGV